MLNVSTNILEHRMFGARRFPAHGGPSVTQKSVVRHNHQTELPKEQQYHHMNDLTLTSNCVRVTPDLLNRPSWQSLTSHTATQASETQHPMMEISPSVAWIGTIDTESGLRRAFRPAAHSKRIVSVTRGLSGPWWLLRHAMFVPP